MAGERYNDVNIPLDLTVEILMKIPAKPLMRFLCVSKQWKNAIRDFIVINSIVTRSLTESPRDPHFIFHTWSSCGRVVVFSYAYPKGNNFQHRKVLDASPLTHLALCQYVRGLIGIWSLGCGSFTIHNPTTSQSISLPDVPSTEERFYLFGYDPLENQYKVVCHTISYSNPFQVLTLGDPTKQWRNIQGSIGTHNALPTSICINGTIYYKAMIEESGIRILASFDVRSKKFDCLQAPETLTTHFDGDSTLVSYQGKLGCISWSLKDVDLWVMEDAKKQEWSKITFLSMLQDLPRYIRISGVTHPGGEFVMVPRQYSYQIPLKVHYYDPKQNRHISFEIKTTRPKDLIQIWAVTDHVENITWL